MSDNQVRIQDDLYKYINQEWIDQAVIPDDRPMVGGFNDLNRDVEKQMIEEFNKLSSGEITCEDASVQKAVQLFQLAKNTEKRNQEGITPVLKKLETIENIYSVDDLNKQLKEFVLESIDLPFVLSVDTDMKDTLHHTLMIGGPSVILPDTTYYKEGMEQQKEALLGIWQQMALQLLAYTPLEKETQEKYVKDTLQFDAILATLVKSSEEWSDYPAIYNPMKTNKVANLLKPLNLKKGIKELFNTVPEEIIVTEPKFVKGFQILFNEENFQLYKHWTYVRTLIGSTSYLSEELREIGSTYSKTLSGITTLPNIEKQAYNIASDCFSEPVGIYYGKKFFGEEAKKDVVEMVKGIIETYKHRVSKNTFLSEETKQKAIVKLDKIVIKMGYPDKADALYDKLDFDANDSLYHAICTIEKIKLMDNISKLNEEVDRGEWVMPGHMVNACYNPFTNDITFPAAILQAPFYSIKQTRSQNLGGIGAVIGHEISHAFDNNGAKCDENGNLNNWWTKEDLKNFKKQTKAMIKEFDGIELEWGKVNGKFVVSENIADNGGMAVTLEMMSKMKEANYEEYFHNWARIWCMKARPEILQLLISIDVHSPAVLRANMQPRNFEEWYQTFGVKKTDKMYLAPSKRVIIW